MKNNPFNISGWLKGEEEEENKLFLRHRLAPFEDVELKKVRQATKTNFQDQAFNPSQYFIPGWRGDALTSKCSQAFNQLIATIQQDAKKQFLENQTLTKSLKLGIYNEFLSYCEYKGLSFSEASDFQSFWSHLQDESSALYLDLIKFVDLYSFRVAVIYFHKIRFISILGTKLKILLSEKELLNPNSFITSIFKAGSSTELKSHALLANHYTWYRPNVNLIEEVKLLSSTALKISITEIVKNVSQKTEEYLVEEKYYSHAISHKHYGLFLNSLLINYPIWYGQLTGQSKKLHSSQNIEAICAKYTGDFLESLSLSHWLAQENNTYLKWDQVICPEFKGDSFITGMYLKVCHELQFLTFITSIAEDQGEETLSYICSILKDKQQNMLQANSFQSMLLPENEQTYDRIIINLINFPRTNPHHHLVGQIEKQGECLRDGGHIFVLSTQKLFVPSQKERVDNLLKKFNLETCINLDQLQGRGEVASYIYIFSKTNAEIEKKYQLKGKRTCLSFRLSGELATFQNFSSITDELQSFYLQNLTDTPPLFQKELENNIRFEFYQDAIVEGRLINSSSKDSSKITHPSFFRNLTSTCVGFDNFFSVKAINGQLFQKSESDNELGIRLKNSDLYQYLMIIDQRHPSRTRLELTTFDTYPHKLAEYGAGLCHYFGLSPKVANINLNLFRYFFESSLGTQIIDLTFRGREAKYKSKLEGLFIPRFFINEVEIPKHLEQCLSLLMLDQAEIKNLNPEHLKTKFNALEPILSKMLENYSVKTFGYCLYFLRSLESLLENSLQKDEVNFNNQALQEDLSKLSTKAIYPGHEEVFIDFKVVDPNHFNLPLSHFEKKQMMIKGETSFYLELYAQSQVLAEIHSSEHLVNFLSYILGYAKNVPLTKILTGIHVPSTVDLKEKLSKHTNLKTEYVSIHRRLELLLEQSLIHKISGLSSKF